MSELGQATPVGTGAVQPRHVSFWFKELPFSLVLIVTMIGVAYTSFSRQPIVLYWEILAPVIGLVCIASGWHNALDRHARLRLVGTQVLHWFAFLLLMNMLLLPSVQVPFSASATGLAVFTLLALGTFTAGVERAVLARRPLGIDHGPVHPGHCLDPEFGVDRRADRRNGRRHRRRDLVALAQVARAVRRFRPLIPRGPRSFVPGLEVSFRLRRRVGAPLPNDLDRRQLRGIADTRSRNRR